MTAYFGLNSPPPPPPTPTHTHHTTPRTALHHCSLLLRVLQGERVVLSGLDDAALRAGLEGVLSALGLAGGEG